jgi:ABC-type glycerol-3-phosphate transport system permease component
MFFVNLFLLLAAVVILIPILFVVASSFSSPGAIARGDVYFWPVEFSTLGYGQILTSPYILKGFSNTLVYTALGTLVSVVLTLLAAYPLSRKDIVGSNIIMFLFAFTMLFSGGMIPTYLVVKELGLLDTIWAMIIPGALSVYNMIITRTFLQTSIPLELYECANLDGCRDTLFLIKIVVPLAKPILAVNVLLYAVGQWNSFFPALLYLRKPELQPLQIVLRDILIAGTNLPDITNVRDMVERKYIRDLMQYSLIIVSCVPVMLLYPFIQKYFVKGIMIGAIKG